MRSNRIAALVVCGLVMTTMGCSGGPPTDESLATSAEMPTDLGDANTGALKDRLIGHVGAFGYRAPGCGWGPPARTRASGIRKPEPYGPPHL